MTAPSFVVVLSPHQNAFFAELAAVLVHELSALGVQACIVTEPHLHQPTDTDVFVLLPPHEYVALEGAAWTDDPLLCARTIGLSAEQPHQGHFDRNGDISALLAAHFDFSEYAVEEYRRRGLRTRHLPMGYTALWDRGATPMAQRVGPEVLYYGNARPRRLATLAEAAEPLSSLRSQLLITDFAFPRTATRPSFLTGEPKRDLLASTRLVLNIHQSDEPYFEWLRFIEATHCGAAVLSERSRSSAPFREGIDLLTFDRADLSSVLPPLAADTHRLDELVGAARESLLAHPFARSVQSLVEAAVELMAAPAPRALPARTRVAPLGPAVESEPARRSASPTGSATDGGAVASFADWQRDPLAHAGSRVLIAPVGFRPFPAVVEMERLAAPVVNAVVAGVTADGSPTLDGWTPWEPWRLERGQHLGLVVLAEADVVAAAAALLADPILRDWPSLCVQITAARMGLEGAHVAKPVGSIAGVLLDPLQALPPHVVTRVDQALAYTGAMSASKYSVQVDITAPAAHGFAVEMVGSNKRVLELGCAAGHITTFLADRGNHVVGVEIDPVAADQARAFAEVVHAADLDAVDLHQLVGDDRFDVVLAGDVLEHLRDPWRTLQQAAALLNPGGSCIVSVPNVAHLDLRLALLGGEWRYRPKGLLDDTHLRFFTRESLFQLAERAGLCVTELRRVIREPFATEVAPQLTPSLAWLAEAALPDDDARTYVYVARMEPRDARSGAIAVSLAASLAATAVAQATEREAKPGLSNLHLVANDHRRMRAIMGSPPMRVARRVRGLLRRG